MTNLKALLPLVIATTATLIAMAPVKALPGPDGFARRGECGQGAEANLVREDDENNEIFGERVVQINLPSSPGREKAAGLIADVLDRGPATTPQRGWRSVILRADTGNTPIADIYAILYFDFGNTTKVVPLNKFVVDPPAAKTGWRSFLISQQQLGGFGGDKQLSRVVFLARTVSAKTRTMKLGKVVIYHANGRSSDIRFLGMKTENLCDEMKLIP